MGRLRSRVVATSLIAFVLLWGIVFVQMVAGNDPVLGAGPKTTGPGIALEALKTSAPEEVEAEVIEPEPLEDVEEEAIEVEPEPEPAPVTTSQS